MATQLDGTLAHQQVVVSEAGQGEIDGLVDDLVARFSSTDDPGLPAAATLAAHELPRDLREAFEQFRQDDGIGLLRVRTRGVDPALVESTPAHWHDRRPSCVTLRAEITIVLMASLLGDLFAWGTQQDGRLVHDILPIRGNENMQLGSSSTSTLTWHTEDAFHEYRADYVGLYCLRNPDRVPTTVAQIDPDKLSQAAIAQLREPHYVIRPDKSHTPAFNYEASVAGRPKESRFQSIARRETDPEPVPVLFGDPELPYARLDPEFMSVLTGHDDAARALNSLVEVVEDSLVEVVLEPGEVCFLDNLRVVHGRRPFNARFDGTDRWLKRVCVTRDLRRSRECRRSANSRVIF